MLVGAAGAGKSTLARRLFTASEILSSDELRAALAGDAANQRVTRRAFAILHREAAARLRERRLVVVDATSVERHARSALRRVATAAEVPAMAIALVPPRADVHARNAGRDGRIVPSDVVDHHLRLVERLGPTAGEVVATLLAEGFDAVLVLTTSDDLDRVVIRRTSAPTPPATH